MQPKITITIPVYNASCTLETCLKSVTNQTMIDIEIICVNDGSTDDSLQILTQFAAMDNRIILINHDENQGILVTRKDAVLKATGRYIMFVDSDDFLNERACEVAYNAITREKVDVLRYGVTCIAGETCDQELLESHRQCHECHSLEFVNKNVIEACGNNLLLWNKIIKADVCKRGYAATENIFCLIGEDIYAMLLIAPFCNSYAEIEDKLYNYNVGIGIANRKERTIKEFEHFAKMGVFFKNVKQFYIDNDIFEYFKDGYNRILSNNILNALREMDISVKPEEQSTCIKMLMHEWGEDLVISEICHLLNLQKEKYISINAKTKQELNDREKEIKTIKSSKRWKIFKALDKCKLIKKGKKLNKLSN